MEADHITGQGPRDNFELVVERFPIIENFDSWRMLKEIDMRRRSGLLLYLILINPLRDVSKTSERMSSLSRRQPENVTARAKHPPTSR